MSGLIVLFGIAVGFAVLCSVLMLLAKSRARSEGRVLHEYFLLGLSGLMAKIAQADGKVTDDEAEMAVSFFNGMKMSESEKALCIGNFIAARRDGLSARDHAKRFIAFGNPVACEFLYSLLWKISVVDGILDPAEDALLAEISLDLGLGRAAYERLKAGDRSAFDRETLRACGVPESLAALA